MSFAVSFQHTLWQAHGAEDFDVEATVDLLSQDAEVTSIVRTATGRETAVMPSERSASRAARDRG